MDGETAQRVERRMRRSRRVGRTARIGKRGRRMGSARSAFSAVAEDLFLRNGYENTSMATVATAAGLSEGTLYQLFPQQDDLVIRVADIWRCVSRRGHASRR